MPMPFSYWSGASLGGRQPPAEQVELVRGVDEGAPVSDARARLPLLDARTTTSASARCTLRRSPSAARETGTMPTSSTPASASRATVSARTAPSFQPGQSTIWTWDLETLGQQSAEHVDRGACVRSHQRDPRLVVPGVERHVEGREAKADDALDVRRGQVRQGDEGPVQEREPVVVVLDVEAGAQARRELVDEAEAAGVPTHPGACTDAVRERDTVALACAGTHGEVERVGRRARHGPRGRRRRPPPRGRGRPRRVPRSGRRCSRRRGDRPDGPPLAPARRPDPPRVR